MTEIDLLPGNYIGCDTGERNGQLVEVHLIIVSYAKAVEQIENVVAAYETSRKGIAYLDVFRTVEGNLSPE